MTRPAPAVRSGPCQACPYRRDVPSGIWSEAEYDKLSEYDEPTADQPSALFMCHATPEALCHGWAVVHSNRGHECELLALRIAGVRPPPPGTVPLFASAAEAAAHGKADIDAPSAEAYAAVERLMRKHERLR